MFVGALDDFVVSTLVDRAVQLYQQGSSMPISLSISSRSAGKPGDVDWALVSEAAAAGVALLVNDRVDEERRRDLRRDALHGGGVGQLGHLLLGRDTRSGPDPAEGLAARHRVQPRAKAL